jgi:hypothetical protein
MITIRLAGRGGGGLAGAGGGGSGKYGLRV